MGRSGYDWNAEKKENSERIIRYLKEHGTVTPRELKTELHIDDLHYYSKYLKKQGYKIEVELKEKINQNGEKVCYTLWTLVSEPKKKE